MTHPDYYYREKKNDIMLVLLESESSLPIAKWTTDPSKPRPGEVLTLVGFGHTTVDYSIPSKLQKAEIPVEDNLVCEAALRPTDFYATLMFCGGDELGHSCSGDSGGPYIDSDGNIVGLAGFGHGDDNDGCGVPPGGAARVGAFEEFIRCGICNLVEDGTSFECWCCGRNPVACMVFQVYEVLLASFPVLFY